MTVNLSCLGRFSVYSGFSRCDCKFSGSGRFQFTQGSVDVPVKSVWLRNVFSLLTQGSVDVTVKSVWLRQVFSLLRVQ